jgi:hypothetical protein
MAQTIDELLRAADRDHLAQRIVALALEHTGARRGSLFLAEPGQDKLTLACHVADGVSIDRPGWSFPLRCDGGPGGIAWLSFELAEPYLCNDTSRDPSYSPYLGEAASILAVPARHQGQPIGVVSIASVERAAFDSSHVAALVRIADCAASHLLRAELHRAGPVAPEPPVPDRVSGLVPLWRPELPLKTLRELREECLGPIEARYLRELLDACNGDVREAARRADVNIVTMYRLLKRRGLKLRRTISG